MLADENLAVLREGCFRYFELGGECINGPVSLLSGCVRHLTRPVSRGLLICPLTNRIIPSPILLARHFFAVALYAIWTLFTHPKIPRSAGPGVDDGQHTKSIAARRPGVDEYPALAVKSVTVVSRDRVLSLLSLLSLFFLVSMSLRLADYVCDLVLDSLRCVWTPCME